MSITQILDELSRLTPQERLHVADHALSLDALSEGDAGLVQQRLVAHDLAPGTAIPLDDFLVQVRTRYAR